MDVKLLGACAGSALQSYCAKSLGALRPNRHFHGTAFFALAVICSALGFYAPTPSKEPPPSNRLASSEMETLRIGRTVPQSFENLDMQAILELRREMVAQHPSLVTGSYWPSHSVFGGLTKPQPWFGTEGFYFYGIGPDSARGPAAASREILNPFMLVSAEFFGLSIWNEGNLHWNFDVATPSRIAAAGFPLYPEMSGVVWDAAQSQAALVYKVSTFLETSAPFLKSPLGVSDVKFSLNTSNARDWGYEYLAITSEGLNGIESSHALDTVVHNNQAYESTSICGLAENCIHIAPSIMEVSSLTAKSLPARVRVKLWRELPANAAKKADFEFTIGLL